MTSVAKSNTRTRSKRSSTARRKPAKPARRVRRRKRSWWSRLIRTTGYLVLFAALGLAGYLLYLDRTITTTFEGRRWSIPAVVYAQPLELYTGAPLSLNEMVVELERVGYSASANPEAPGSYKRTGNRLTVMLHAFRFIDGRRPAGKLALTFTGAEISTITFDGLRRAVLRLDPPSIGSFFASHGEDRIILSPEQAPPLLEEGLKAVEDRNFDRHPGFDVIGIARAMWANLQAGEITQGGSTLTQQLVRSYFLDNSRTLSRKLREVAMAIILDARFTKADLLNAYINEIFLGQEGSRAIHGFGLGAQFYFAKHLGKLTHAEIATLLTIIRGPSYYNPFRYPERVTERRNRILDILHTDGLLDATALRIAKRTPLVVTRAARRGGTYYPAFMDLVRENLRAYYDQDELGSGGLTVFTTLNPRLQESTANAVKDALDRLERSRRIETGKLQAASVITQTQTGEVLALIGGREAGVNGFNRALNAVRPAGSLLKPVVYLTALEQGQHLASIVEDAPVEIDARGPTPWSPRNFDGEVHGPVPLIRALGDSLNLATVNLGMDIGVNLVAERIADLGGKSPSNHYPSLLLGAESLSPLDITRLYGNFASGGFFTPPKAVIAVQAENGESLSHHPFKPALTIDPGHASTLSRALELVMREGTGKHSRFARAGVAGKTGTSDDFRDSWFAGYDADKLTVVWVGADDNSPINLTGASGAMRVWDEIMLSNTVVPLIHPSVHPGAADLVEIDYMTGMLAKPGCAERLVRVSVPIGTSLHVTPGCDISRQKTLTDRIRSWFQND